MLTPLNVLIGLAMLVGTAGIVVPVLPGLFLVWLATVVWASEQQTAEGWVVLAVATTAYAAGLVGQYLVPGRRLRAAGVETWVLAMAAVVAVVGFFVVPVVGAPVGFVGAVYVLERRRHRAHDRAWAATGQALRAMGLGMGIELLSALAIMTTWVVGVWASQR
ncbi:MAG TPA: DUF456 domain-containing protein [Intrasporangium sp.]|uniref:DUF456 domain-containing protein n=1 Tax=Intrasporangium sp. TaxID=1925024 RepID=UPI002D78AB2E|nr:DUF456 domain-containing protein [Intrasporangium sp.]HET7399336.1 DUF456 domain-containing protein [Intrasporangium sp.]